MENERLRMELMKLTGKAGTSSSSKPETPSQHMALSGHTQSGAWRCAAHVRHLRGAAAGAAGRRQPPPPFVGVSMLQQPLWLFLCLAHPQPSCTHAAAAEVLSLSDDGGCNQGASMEMGGFFPLTL